MGLWKDMRCPMCGKEGARKFLWMVKCPLRGCPNYDYRLDDDASSVDTSARPRKKVQHRGSFDPGEFAVTIFYTNYLDEECEFITDWRTLMEVGKHVSACLVPTGTRCAFKIAKVANFHDLEPYVNRLRVLNKTERRILSRYIGRGDRHERVPNILEKLG